MPSARVVVLSPGAYCGSRLILLNVFFLNIILLNVGYVGCPTDLIRVVVSQRVALQGDLQKHAPGLNAGQRMALIEKKSNMGWEHLVEIRYSVASKKLHTTYFNFITNHRARLVG